MDINNDQEMEELEIFQQHVADRFAHLLSPTTTTEENASSEPLLSIPWLRKLVDVFLCCEAEYKAVLVMGRDPSQICKPPLDRLIPELLERAVKAMDICYAVSGAIDSILQCQKIAEIAISALEKRPMADGEVKRARKALISLLTAITNDENTNCRGTERTWSFGKRGNTNNKEESVGNFRSLSVLVAKNWSAAKQIHAMSTNLVAPRGGEPTGLASLVYIMNCVMVFVMWALVAAVPCQDRSGLAAHFQIPRHLVWANSMIGLQEKIGEEWKKKDKKGSAGLLDEMHRMEKLGQSLVEFADAFQFPGETDKLEEVAAQVAELADICRSMEEGLLPLQMQLREVFHRLARSRTEVLDLVEIGTKMNENIT